MRRTTLSLLNLSLGLPLTVFSLAHIGTAAGRLATIAQAETAKENKADKKTDSYGSGKTASAAEGKKEKNRKMDKKDGKPCGKAGTPGKDCAENKPK